MLTDTQLANKRTRKAMRRRALHVGRRRNRPSAWRGRRRIPDTYELAQRNAALVEQQAASKAAIKSAASGKRGGFLDRVKSKLRGLLPRRRAV